MKLPEGTVEALIQIGQAGLLLLIGLVVIALCAYASWASEQRSSR